MSKLIKEIMDALNAVNQNKTEPYDRQGEVKRIEDKIAWVKLEGSDRETPIQMTIACDVGDTVQARIGGGSAWLTGNLTAPPTDDKKANEAISMVTTVVQEVQEQVEEALEEATDVEDVTMQYCLSDSSSTFVQYGDWSDTPPEYVSGKYYWVRSVLVDDDGNETYGEPRYSQETQLSVETSRAYATTNAHFWYDNTGAYVTDSTQTAYKADATGKYATRVTPTGILQSYSGNTLSSWTSSGISFYQGDSNNTPTASFGSGGAEIYSGGTSVASFGSTARIGANSGVHVTLEAGSGAGWLKFYNSSGTLSGRIESHSSGVRLTNNVGTYHSYYDVSDNGYLTLSAAHTVQIDADQNISIDASGMTFIDGDSGVVMNSALTVYNTITASGARFNSVYTYNNRGSVESANLYVNSNGNFMRIADSSRRYKEDIEDAGEQFDPHGLYEIPFRQFRYKKGYFSDDCEDPHCYDLQEGFIAEEVYEHFPAAASVVNGVVETWSPRHIIPPMLALIQEQNKRITELEKRVL